MSVVFHVTLLNILGFVHLPEKVLDTYFVIKGVPYFVIKGVLNLITCSMGVFFGRGRGGTFVRFFNFSIQ
jgi:hypothetical protein